MAGMGQQGKRKSRKEVKGVREKLYVKWKDGKKGVKLEKQEGSIC